MPDRRSTEVKRSVASHVVERLSGAGGTAQRKPRAANPRPTVANAFAKVKRSEASHAVERLSGAGSTAQRKPRAANPRPTVANAFAKVKRSEASHVAKALAAVDQATRLDHEAFGTVQLTGDQKKTVVHIVVSCEISLPTQGRIQTRRVVEGIWRNLGFEQRCPRVAAQEGVPLTHTIDSQRLDQ